MTSEVIVYDGTQNPIVLETPKLPDVRQQLTPTEVQQARQLAKSINIDDALAVIEFGTKDVGMSAMARQMMESVKVGEVRGTPVDQLLQDLLLVKQELDPRKLVAPSVKERFSAIFRLKDVVGAYIDNYQSMQTQMQELQDRLQRYKDTQRSALQQGEVLKSDANSLYTKFTVVEASGLYLLQRMQTEYQRRRAQLVEGDLLGAQQLAELADRIGQVDRTIFELHSQRAHAIIISQEIGIAAKADQELYRMLSVELAVKFPLFMIELANFIKVLRSKGILDRLKEYQDQQNRQGEALSQATHQLATEVARTSESSVDDVQRFMARYKRISETIDQVVQTHKDGQEKRRAAEKELDVILNDIEAKTLDINPSMRQIPG